MTQLRVFEAFAGYGSQSMALRNIGVDYNVVGISEIDEYAIQAYHAIHGNVINYGDITQINTKDIPDHDLFTYSFPCTDISICGKQNGIIKNETRSGLLWDCEKIIDVKRPKYLLMENVKALIGKKFKNDFDKWCNLLEDKGYQNYYQVLNAKNFGIPQNRERVIMISILGEHQTFEFPIPIQLATNFGDLLDNIVDKKYYLPIDKIIKINNWKSFQNPFDRVVGKKELCPTLTARGAGEYHAGAIILGECDYNTNIRQEIINDVSKTYEKYKLRFLTPCEAFRFMGVSDTDFDKIKYLPDKELYKLAGNSIVCDVLEAVFKQLLK